MNITFKKLVTITLTITLLLVQFLGISNKAYANFDVDVNSAILIDASTGKVLFEKNADIELGIASMSKMMTEYLILEGIANNKLSWDQTVPISPWVAQLSHTSGTSNVYLEVDATYTVKDLYEAVAIESGNAATIALAEMLGGSYTKFVQMMNDKANELQLKDYHFVNSTGLPNSYYKDNRAEGTSLDDENRMTARTTATLAYHLVNDFPEVLETASIPMKYFQGEIVTDKSWQQCLEDWTCMKNWNDMLPGFRYQYDGLDGLKTGHTTLAKYTFTGTAKQGDIRLISVVMGAETIEKRFAETKKLLDYGFNYFETITLTDTLTIPVVKGKEKELVASPENPLKLLIASGEEELYKPVFVIDETLLNEDGSIIAPIEKDQVIGWLTFEFTGENNFSYITDDSNTKEKVPVLSEAAIEEAGWFSLTLRAIGGFFSGIWTTVSDSIKGIFS